MLKFFTESLVYSEILGKGNRSLSYNYYGITNAQIMQRIALLLLFEMVEIHIAFIEKLSLWKWDLCIGKCWMLRKKKSRKLSHIFSKSKISVALKIKFEPRTCATFLIYCFISRILWRISYSAVNGRIRSKEISKDTLMKIVVKQIFSWKLSIA